ncbi:LysR substrate-binding domain-containing protein [Pinisolibacter aquiterrae]|uniref:LysR substrate-binding domain-containing protein n=1 Tax=Pinisolibacter aquiterrae TaxID=2815579 RepID=UPI001C3CE365|nr:LysR substrate-binding domain-containing protein [Pinisolibacter aquiterrae]MBV5263420.1 LysR family transcriptional regulator [Pinisolibacter aquiterrae]MCC8237503.1 LysR family transcriptional regulator [Pinisolibacter aquiterrae]
MNLRDLQYVLAVADLGHFGRAAEACHVSQPTLSGQILKLEDELGVRIFERVGRSIRPTPVGEQILAHARRAVSSADDITALARASRDPLAGPLRLGVIPTLAPYLMPFVLPIAAEALPAAPLMLYEDLTANLLQALTEGRLEAAIIASDPGDSRLTSHLLFDEPFWVVLPPGHPLAARETIHAADLDPKSLLLLADGHCLRDQALEFCGHPDRGEGAGADIRATSLETLLHLTAANYGITLVPRLAVGNDIGLVGKLETRPLEGDHHFRRVRLVHRANTPRQQALALLAAMIRKGVPEGVERLDG